MPMLAMPPQKHVVEYSVFYEAHAVGKAANDLREEKEKELNQVTQGSVFRQHWLLVNLAQQQITTLSHLRTNWDSYGAPPPNDAAIENATRILLQMHSPDLEKVKIVPSGEGGIGLCFKTRDRYADLETSNDGSILGVRYAGMEAPILIPVDGSEGSIKAALEQIRNHVGE
jgi:hypothetical protein